MKTKNYFNYIPFFISITLFISCSKPAETKEEMMQKGVVMSDTLLKSVDGQLQQAQKDVDSAEKAGLFTPPPANAGTVQATSGATANQGNQKK